MTLPARILGALMILPAASAQAQQTQPTNADLMKAIQALGRQLDRLEKRSTSPADNATAAAVPVPAQPAPAARGPVRYATVPGWKVEVVPIEDEKKDAVASFDWAKPDLNFGLHTKLIAGHNEYSYRGVARFHPDEKARYVFSLTLQPLRNNLNWFYTCQGRLKLNDELLTQGKLDGGNGSGDYDRNGELFSTLTLSGGAELEPSADSKEDYVLSFLVSCTVNGRQLGDLPEQAFKGWSDNRFSVLVKGPDDSAPRPFASNELYHGGRIRAAR